MVTPRRYSGLIGRLRSILAVGSVLFLLVACAAGPVDPTEPVPEPDDRTQEE